MLFRTHIVFSLVVYFLISYYIAMPFYVLIFALLAAAFVDIDVGNSKFEIIEITDTTLKVRVEEGPRAWYCKYQTEKPVQ